MNGAEIAHAIVKDGFLKRICLGVFPSDRLPQHIPHCCCFVANEDPATKEGSHWVAFYVVGDGTCNFFDSYGRRPRNKHFIKFLHDYDVTWNGRQVQDLFSTACGQHSLHFLFNRSRGLPFNDIIQLYSSDHKENDSSVCAFVNDMFDLSTPITDAEFLSSQICRQFHP